MTDRYAETDTWPNPPASQQPARPATLSEVEYLRRAHWEMTQEAARLRAEIERLKRGGAELGRILDRTLRDALDASGRHDVIEEDGDGDWALVWETLAELRPRAEAAEAEVERLRDLAQRNFKQGAALLGELQSAERARDAALAEVTELRDRLGRVEALADEWERHSLILLSAGTGVSMIAHTDVVGRLRRALAAEPAEATASRPPETSGAGSIAPVAAEEGGEQEAGEVTHELLHDPTPRNEDQVACLCGEWSWDGNDPESEAAFVVHAQQSSLPAPSGFDEQGNPPATPDANGVHDTKGGECQSCGHQHSPNLGGICIGCPCTEGGWSK